MPDRQQLFQQLLTYLDSTPELPEYLAQAPDSDSSFDPYQMVGEWIALRQEMKQQGKLLQAAQEQLQRELEAARSHNDQLQQQLLTIQTRSPSATDTTAPDPSKEKESFLRNLLNVMDALDRACYHWQEQEEAVVVPISQPHPSQGGWRYGLARWFVRLSHKLAPLPAAAPSPDLLEVMKSDRQGIELIRLNLLDLLKQQQVTPIPALGQAFNARYMYALGRQPNAAPAGTIIQEVVRGYEWGDRILREAQVIVSAGMSTPS
jgi:molecular chaperone GrpE